jgi:formamidopyrimidine-DNA glycosylase
MRTSRCSGRGSGRRRGRVAWSRVRLARLVEEVRTTLTEAIAKGGSTLRDYVDSEGEPGYFQLEHYVYGRAGQPCRVCASTIRMLRQGGRATTYCPACQR